MEAVQATTDGLVRIQVLAEENWKDSKHVNRKLYQLLCDESVLITAYERIKSKSGNMTKGIDHRTLDGYSLNMIKKVTEELKTETFQFSPVRVREIPKKSGTFRRLGIAPPPEKIIQEAMRMIVEAIYEPTFSENSHGFRPARGCHSALKQVYDQWKGVKWIIEGDIKGFFDNVDHHVLIGILRKRIKDERFIKLIWKALRAGKLVVQNDDKGRPRTCRGKYIGTFYQTKVGTPQGSIVSPVLANVYLNEFDHKVEEWIQEVKSLKTANRRNPEYRSINGKVSQMYKEVDLLVSSGGLEIRSQEHKEAIRKIKALRVQQRKTKCTDDSYRAIKYVRYADDWLIGIYGPKEMATTVKSQAESYLQEILKLELSPEKTLITRPDKEKIKFLGVYIKEDPKGRTVKYRSGNAKRIALSRSGKGAIKLEAPITELMDKLAEDRFSQKGSNKPKARRDMVSRQEWEIVMYYNSVLRGILNYYSFVANRSRMSQVIYTLQSSLLHTIAARRKCTIRQVWKKGKGRITALKPVKDGMKPIHFCGQDISLKMDQKAFLISAEELDPKGLYKKHINLRSRSKLGCHCAVCGKNDRVQMHHVRHIRKMGQKTEGFTQLMAQLNRKQIPVCHDCHWKIHNGKYDGLKLSDFADQELARW